MSYLVVLHGAFAVILLAVSGFAFWKGGPNEKAGAVAMLMAWVTTISILEITNRSANVPIALIDIALLAVLVALIFRSDRAWPIWATGFHLLSMTSHFLFLLGLSEVPAAYRLALLAASFGVAISLAVGTFWVWQEREALRPLE